MKLGWIAALTLLSCTANPLPPDAPEAAMVKPASPAQSSSPRALHALDLVSDDGELLIFADLAQARRSPAFPLVRLAFEYSYPLFEQIATLCNLDIFARTETMAAAAHQVERTIPFVVAKMNATEEEILTCARKLRDEDRDAETPLEPHATIGGHDAIALPHHGYSGASIVFVDGWLFYGSPTDVRRGLSRMKPPHASDVLHGRIPHVKNRIAAVAFDSGVERLRRADLSLFFTGEELSAVARLESERGAKDHDEIRRAIARAANFWARRARENLGQAHPLVGQIEQANIQAVDDSLTAEWKLTLSPRVGLEIAAAVQTWRRDAPIREVKQLLGAMTRGAAAAYERELPSSTGGPLHVLCKSAIDVPASVPAGTAYTPIQQSGKDYRSGDVRTGWKCLKFEISTPQRYQLSYRVGGNYKGPKRGGPDPGPHGFEVSAEGDLDGDGNTSLFTVTGTVNPQTKLLWRSSEVFISDGTE